MKNYVTLGNLPPLPWQRFQTFISFCLYNKEWDEIMSKAPSRKPGSVTAWSRPWNPSAGALWLGRYPTARKLGLLSSQLCDWRLTNPVTASGWENRCAASKPSEPYCRSIKAIWTVSESPWSRPAKGPQEGGGGILSSATTRVCLFPNSN